MASGDNQIIFVGWQDQQSLKGKKKERSGVQSGKLYKRWEISVKGNQRKAYQIFFSPRKSSNFFSWKNGISLCFLIHCFLSLFLFLSLSFLLFESSTCDLLPLLFYSYLPLPWKSILLYSDLAQNFFDLPHVQSPVDIVQTENALTQIGNPHHILTCMVSHFL